MGRGFLERKGALLNIEKNALATSKVCYSAYMGQLIIRGYFLKKLLSFGCLSEDLIIIL